MSAAQFRQLKDTKITNLPSPRRLKTTTSQRNFGFNPNLLKDKLNGLICQAKLFVSILWSSLLLKIG
jgi:hypothetical protein